MLDSSGNSNTGTLEGAATWVAGRYGSALSFNGTSNRVFVNDSTSLDLSTAMTLEAWVQPTAAQSGWRAIVQKEVDGYFLHASWHGIPLAPAAGGTFGGSVQNVMSSSAMLTNAWTHLAVTYDGAAIRLYVNGLLVGTQVASGAIEVNANPLWIGGNTYSEYFQGLIDEVRIYNRALNQTAIETDMATPVSGP